MAAASPIATAKLQERTYGDRDWEACLIRHQLKILAHTPPREPVKLRDDTTEFDGRARLSRPESGWAS